MLLLLRIRTDNWHDNYGLLLSENTESPRSPLTQEAFCCVLGRR